MIWTFPFVHQMLAAGQMILVRRCHIQGQAGQAHQRHQRRARAPTCPALHWVMLKLRFRPRRIIGQMRKPRRRQGGARVDRQGQVLGSHTRTTTVCSSRRRTVSEGGLRGPGPQRVTCTRGPRRGQLNAGRKINKKARAPNQRDLARQPIGPRGAKWQEGGSS